MASEYKFDMVNKVLNLIDERDRYKAKCKAYEHQMAEAPDQVEQAIYKYGVQSVMKEVTDRMVWRFKAGVEVEDGKAEEYEEWLERQVKEGSFMVPSFLSVDQFIAYFESELREYFTEKKDAALKAAEDAEL